MCPHGTNRFFRILGSQTSTNLPRKLHWSPFAGDFFSLLLLASVIAAVYGSVISHQYVAWDDVSYVSDNAKVLAGLTWSNVFWAFSTFQLANWHPLTLVSHMLDVSLWGAKPGIHAATNVVIHLANTALLYLVVRRVLAPLSENSRSIVLALAMALAFAVHPLHVESVAWISQRKDVLCAFFWLLAIHAYLSYVRNPTPAAYFGVTCLISLSLMSKPMAVTLPLTLLILDWWPLRRWPGRANASGWLPLYEKLPWFGLSALVGVLTVMAQTQAMPSYGILERIHIALMAYGWYLVKSFYPSGLHFYYLAEIAWDAAGLLASIAALLFISVGSYKLRYKRPELLAGWLWFLITLLPVVGFVKVGTQAWADRYTYVPHIGLFWMLLSLARFPITTLMRQYLSMVAFAAIMVCFAWISAAQVGVWKNTTTLYQHALSQNSNHYVAIMGLANQALRDKEYDKAQRLAERALSLSNGAALVRAMRGVLGDVALVKGDIPSAISHYERGGAADQLDDGIRSKLGLVYLQNGQFVEAELSYREALRRSADSVEALNGLGVALGLQGRLEESYSTLLIAVGYAPHNRGLRHNLAATAVRAGNTAAAKAAYSELLKIYPDDAVASKALAELPEPSG